MDPLERDQLGRLLRDLELTAPVALLRAAPQADLHLWLLMRIREAPARTDDAFQRRLARYVGLRGKLRANRAALFELLEVLVRIEAPVFEDVLCRVGALTGQVEKSAASALLSLLDPDQPSIDRDLRELLPRYGFPPLAEAPRFDECVAWHARLCGLFAQVLASPRWGAISSRLDASLPAATGAALSETRKLNLHLSQLRRLVALMPVLEPAPPPTRSGSSGAATTVRSGRAVLVR